MKIAFLFMLNVVLVTRLPLFLRDSRVSGLKVLVLCFVQLLALVAFQPNTDVVALSIAIVSLGMLTWVIEKNRQPSCLPVIRLFVLVLYLLTFAILFNGRLDLYFRQSLPNFSCWLESWFLPARVLAQIHWGTFHVWAAGILFCLNEANLVVRYLLDRLNLRPPALQEKGQKNAITEETEYNRGRIIGLMERTLIFFFVVRGDFATLGFVAALKGFARFKSLDDRVFAEYFLIGTMLSVLIAGSIGLLVRYLLPA